ncbi:MAG: hypothetical protein C0423_19135 [Methylibium sp.]|nr:hypothetical protein [Methylibium sp.]
MGRQTVAQHQASQPRRVLQRQPVAQLALNEDDTQRFQKWLAEQPFKLSERQQASIIRYCNTVDTAVDQAKLDAEADVNIAKKQKLYATLSSGRGKAADRAKTPQDRQSILHAKQRIDDAIEELGAAREHGGLGPELVSAVDSLAEVLLETHPSDRFTYVLMGNSPAPLLAWLLVKGYDEAAVHLPLGGLTTPVGEKVTESIGSGALPAPIRDYFDTALRPALERRLPLVLIDYVSTGGSLVKTADYIKRWLAERRVDLPVTFFGYSEHTFDETPALTDSPHEGVLATSQGKAENIFTKLNADKAVKEVLLIKGPATLDIGDLLKGQVPNAQPGHWHRVLRLMRDALTRDD